MSKGQNENSKTSNSETLKVQYVEGTTYRKDKLSKIEHQIDEKRSKDKMLKAQKVEGQKVEEQKIRDKKSFLLSPFFVPFAFRLFKKTSTDRKTENL